VTAAVRMATLASLALLTGLTRPATLPAQAPARIIGRVIDATTQAPVAEAEVLAGDLHAVAGSDGGFLIGSVPPGRIRVEVRRIGYAPWAAVVEVLPGLDRTVAVALVPVAVRLDSLLVLGTDAGLSITGDELARRGQDLGRALDGWEGVAVRRTGSSGPASPQLRGGGPDEVLVLVDGFALNDPLSGRADLSRIASREVAKVTLVPGAQSVRAGGRAIAGVLAIETRRDLRPEGATWAGSHGALGARVGASTGALTFTAAHERYASAYPYTVPEVRGGGEATRENAGGSVTAATGRLDGPIELTVRGSQSTRGLPGTTTNPTPDAHAEDRSVLLGVRRNGELRASGSLQWLEARAADPQPVAGPPYDSYTHGIGGTVELARRTNAELEGWAGVAGIAVEARGDRFSGDGVRDGASFSHAALRFDAAVHRGHRDVVTLAPAVRFDVWTGHATPVLSARLDAGWQRDGTALTAAVGSAVSPPVLADLFFREGVGVRLNPNLRPERVRWELEAGVRQELGPAGSLGSASLRAFYGHVDDMVLWAPDFRFIWSPQNYDVLRRGGEATLALKPTRWLRADATATLAAVTYDVPGGAQVQYRPRVTYAAGLAGTAGAWDVDLRWHYIGERYPNSAGTNARPAFSLIDAGLERRLGEWLGARLEVHDLADVRAEFIAGYPTPGRTLTATLNFQVP
jgi:vitamin B12 transporter